ncbi:Catalase-related peroxidase [Pseudocercospora fuligena]|uniref:Catalase-related peroxidase n=1 Tax=Pseudocercospora fuligena TaxID=685502 RepID=A0A8H6R6S5_9PEZI|nr:Catalase-related peroxidase [Pseudocercospora fuligena]
MPLTDNTQTLETANALVKGLRGAFNTPEAYRPAHARGRITKGTFTPTPEAASLSKAPHFNNASTPVIARFSNSTGIPNIPDNDNNASPRGIGLRFVLEERPLRRHTDIIAHSTKFFPVKTGEGFLELLGHIGGGTLGEYLPSHPPALAFVQDPKPHPESFATEKFWAVNAFKLVAADGKETFVRYQILPEKYKVLGEEKAKEKSESYLAEELEQRLQSGPAVFKLLAQIAADGDVTDDATKLWPEERKSVELGTIKVDTMEPVEESLKDEKKIIFDPIPRVDGIEPSDDPLLDMRAAIYLLSGRIRRAASMEA